MAAFNHRDWMTQKVDFLYTCACSPVCQVQNKVVIGLGPWGRSLAGTDGVLCPECETTVLKHKLSPSFSSDQEKKMAEGMGTTSKELQSY